MLDHATIRETLRSGTTVEPGERLAGQWMLWLARNEAHLGPEPRYEWQCERISKRQGKEVVGQSHTRKQLYEVYVLSSDYDLSAHWPRYDGGAYKGLTDGEALMVLGFAIEAKEG